MLDAFIDHLNKHLSLSAEDINFVSEVTKVKSFGKGEYLLKEGEISKAFYFNLTGFVRLFYNRKGEEKTAYFYEKGQFISAYSSFVKQIPSTFYLQATEDTDVVVIGYDESMKLLNYSNKFETLARIAMEEELMAHQEMISVLLLMSPEERYNHLLDTNSDVFQRVPQIQIATYLGVTPESLSRIKKRSIDKS